MQWAARRQLIILAIVLGVIIILGIIFLVPALKKEPTCFDGKQNGDETGIDCGGSCPRLCQEEMRQIIVEWARPFAVAANLYNAVAYIKNQNIEGAVFEIPYQFRLYDKDNVFIAAREGKTFIEPNKNSVIFESRILVGNRVPTRAEFKFLASPQWIRVPKETMDIVSVSIKEKKLSDLEAQPRLTTTIINDSLYNIPELDIVALLYGKNGNVVAASKTFIEHLPERSSRKLFFRWSAPFGEEVVRIEIIPRINLLKLKL